MHGVPVSLKDMLDVEGYDTTLGFTHKRNQPAAKDASLVSLIRKVRPTLLPLSLPLTRSSKLYPGPDFQGCSSYRPAVSPLSSRLCLKRCSRSNAAPLSSAYRTTPTTRVVLPEVRLAVKEG